MDTNGLGVKGRHETLLRGRLSPLRRVIRRMVRHTTHSVSFRPGSQLQGSSQSPARRLAGPATVAAIASLVAFIFPGVGVDTCPGFEAWCVLWSLEGWKCLKRKLGGWEEYSRTQPTVLQSSSCPSIYPSIHGLSKIVTRFLIVGDEMHRMVITKLGSRPEMVIKCAEDMSNLGRGLGDVHCSGILWYHPDSEFHHWRKMCGYVAVFIVHNLLFM